MEQPFKPIKSKSIPCLSHRRISKAHQGFENCTGLEQFFLTVAPPKTARLDRDKSLADNWLTARFIS
jgi:hypothetical protein